MARWALPRPDHNDVPGRARISAIAGVSADMVSANFPTARIEFDTAIGATKIT